MQHHTDPQPGPHISRTGCQVSELRMKRVQDCSFQLIVQLINALPSRLEIQAAMHHLNPEMIFFIDHHAVFAREDQ